MSKRLLRTALVLSATALALVLPPSGLAGAFDAASGSGTVVGILTPGQLWEEEWRFEFSATSGPAGENATGVMSVIRTRVFLDGTTTVESASAAVGCLAVDGDRAEIRGVVTESSGLAAPGAVLVFWVVDAAGSLSGADEFFFSVGLPPTLGCGSTFLGTFAIATGDIVVADDAPDDRTAAEQLADLIAELQAAPAGAGGSYLAKLQAIAASMADDNLDATCNQLGALAHEVEAQAGKKLSLDEARALLDEVAAIRASAGCP